MSHKDISTQVTVVDAIPPAAARTGGVNGTVVDRRGYMNCVAAVDIATKENGTGDETLSVKLQHGTQAGGGDMADLTAAEAQYAFNDAAATDGTFISILAGVAQAAAVLQKRINLQGLNRYIRLVETPGGTMDTGHILSAVFVLNGYYKRAGAANASGTTILADPGVQ